MCGVYVAFGMILLAIPPMVTQVRTELDVSRGTLGFALGAWALLYIVTAPPAGQIIDRIGLRRSLAAGSLLIATSAAVQSAAQDVAMLWLAIGDHRNRRAARLVVGAEAGRRLVHEPARTRRSPSVSTRRRRHSGACAHCS